MACEQLQGFVAPEQLDQRTGILVGVLGGGTERIERDGLGTAANQEHAPPLGDELESGLDMPWTDDKGNPVQHTTIRRRLGGQPSQPVSIRLDLVAMKNAAHR